jgi:hypothetical protein
MRKDGCSSRLMQHWRGANMQFRRCCVDQQRDHEAQHCSNTNADGDTNLDLSQSGENSSNI